MLKLTRSDGNSIYVQAIYIAFMSRSEDSTYINIAGNDTIWVQETPEQIMALVGGPNYVATSDTPTVEESEQ